VGETISLKIGTPKYVKIGAQCSDEEKMNFSKLPCGFQDVFAWSYEDIPGFDPGLIQHATAIKEGMEPVRKKQRPINPALKTTIQRELENFLKARVTFPVKYPEWVSRLVHVPKVTDHIIFWINFLTFNQAIMKNPFPPPNMEMILQQVVKSQMRPLLDNFFGCNQIKGERVDSHKTTLITIWCIMTYECMLSGLPDESTIFKRPMQITLDELINIHIYLDDLIAYVKGLLITSKFQKLWLGPFKIAFVLGTNSYILKYLQEQLSSYNNNGSHLKHYVEPT
jgi:hypothetical protein